MDNTQSAFDTAQVALRAAQAGLAAANESRRAAQSRVEEAFAVLDQNKPVDAKVAAARAAAALAQARIATATAPADGLLSRLTVLEGRLIVPGQALAAVVPARSHLIANFKETQIGRMAPGQFVEVKLDAFEWRVLHDVLESLAGGNGSRFSLLPPENASGNFVKVLQLVPVRIAWSDLPPELPIGSGMSAVVTVHTVR